MGGGLLQLVAYGVQDLIFTDKAEITFFKNVYNRHTNFSIDQKFLNFRGICRFGELNRCILKREGDLLGQIYLCINIPEIRMKYTKQKIDRIICELKECDIIIDKQDIIVDITYLCIPPIDDTLNFITILNTAEDVLAQDINIFEKRSLINNTISNVLLDINNNMNNSIVKDIIIQKLSNLSSLVNSNTFITDDNTNLENYYKLKEEINKICICIQNVEETDRLIINEVFDISIVNQCIENSKNTILNNNLINEEIELELLLLQEKILDCVPFNSEYAQVIEQCISDIILNLTINNVIVELTNLQTKLDNINFEILEIEQIIYNEICNRKQLVQTNNVLINELNSRLENCIDSTIPELQVEIIKVLLDKTPLYKIYCFLLALKNDLLNGNDEQLTTIITLFSRITNNLRKYIIRKITIDDLTLIENEEQKQEPEQILIPELNINLITRYLLSDTDNFFINPPVTKKVVKINNIYYFITFTSFFGLNIINSGLAINNITLVQYNINSMILSKTNNFDDNNPEHVLLYDKMLLFTQQYPSPNEVDCNTFFTDDVDSVIIDNQNIIQNFNIEKWGLDPFNFYIRFGSTVEGDFVDFLDIDRLDIVIKVRNLVGIEFGPLFDSSNAIYIDLINFIQTNIYNPTPYFSDDCTFSSNMYFLNSLKNVLEPESIVGLNEQLNNIVISGLTNYYESSNNYNKLDGYLAIKPFLEQDLSQNFELKQADYSEKLITSLRYNFNLFSNIFKLPFINNLTINNKFVLNDLTCQFSFLQNGSSIDEFIGNIEYLKIINQEFNKQVSIDFFNNWGEYYTTINDIGENLTTFSNNIQRLQNFNLLFQYIQFVFKSLVERVAKFYKFICEKYIMGQNNIKQNIDIITTPNIVYNSRWDHIQIYPNPNNKIYYVNKLYYHINDTIKTRLIENIDNIYNQYINYTVKSVPDPPVEITIGNDTKLIQFCKEIVPPPIIGEAVYHCFELVELEEGSLEFLEILFNKIKEKVEEIHNDMNTILENIIQANEPTISELSNLEPEQAHFLYTHYTNGNDISDLFDINAPVQPTIPLIDIKMLQTSKLSMNTIIFYYKFELVQFNYDDIMPEFNNINYPTYNNSYDYEIEFAFENVKNRLLDEIEFQQEYELNKIREIEKKADEFFLNGYNNNITSCQIIQFILNRNSPDLATVPRFDPNITPDKTFTDHDYEYVKYVYSNSSLRTHYDLECQVPFLLETYTMHNLQFEWFFIVILNEWLINNFVGSVMEKSMILFKSNLFSNLEIVYDIYNRLDSKNTVHDLNNTNFYNIQILNKSILQPTVDQTVLLINNFNYVLDIYEFEKRWFSCINKATNNNADEFLSKKEDLFFILKKLLLDKYNTSESDVEDMKCAEEFALGQNFIINPEQDTRMCEIVRYIFDLELNRYSTVEDYFGYKNPSFQPKVIDNVSYFKNNYSSNLINLNPYTVLKYENIDSYYYHEPLSDETSIFTNDINLLVPVKGIFPVFYDITNQVDKLLLPSSISIIKEENMIQELQPTFIEIDKGRLLRYDETLNTFYFIDNGNEAKQIDIQDSDEFGNLLFTNTVDTQIIKEFPPMSGIYINANSGIQITDTNILNNLQEKINLLERIQYTNKNCDPLFYNTIDNKLYIDDNGYRNNETGDLYLGDPEFIFPAYEFNVQIRNNYQIYEFFIQSELIDINGPTDFVSGNVNILFIEELTNRIVQTNNTENFIYQDDLTNFVGDKSTLIPLRAINPGIETDYTILVFHRNFYNLSEIKYIGVRNLSDLVEFNNTFNYNPNLPYPIRYLLRPTDTQLYELNNHVKDIVDTENRQIFINPLNNQVVLKYNCKYTIEISDDNYPYNPQNLIPELVDVPSDVFNMGDNDGIAMTFNNQYPECIDEFAQIYCDIALENLIIRNTDFYRQFLTTRQLKSDLVCTSINHLLSKSIYNNLIDNEVLNSIYINNNDVEGYKRHIIEIFDNENKELLDKIDELQKYVPNEQTMEPGRINDILNGSDYANFAWVRRLGHFIIDYVEIEISGQIIDKHYGTWINIWYELTKKVGKINGYDRMIGDVKELITYDNNKKPEYKLYIPLYFWFCKNSGFYMPLVALHYTEIHLNVKFRPLEDVAYWEKDTEFVRCKKFNDISVTITDKPQLRCNVLAQYVYVSEKERNRLASIKHEYIMEQLQFDNSNIVSEHDDVINAKLYFNNPCKEFIWNIQYDRLVDGSLENGEKQWYNYTVDPYIYDSTRYRHRIKKSKFKICDIKYNNQVLYSYIKYQKTEPYISNTSSTEIKMFGNIRVEGDNTYFEIVHPTQHHSHSPAIGTNLYSFSLYPEQFQPSGSCNMTKINDSLLKINLADNLNMKGQLFIYSPNYNVFRVLSGLCGLAFS